MQFTDIHAHMVPAVDDGARDDAMALQMLQLSYASGVRNILLTPHYNEKMDFTCAAAKMQGRMEALAAQVARDLRVYMGNEVYYSGNITEGLKSKAILTLAGSRYVLVEFSFSADYKKIYEGVYQLIIHGYWPVVAHAERYESLLKEPDGVNRLTDLGAYIQVNAKSVYGGSFSVKRRVKKWIESGLVSFVASDCHNVASRPPNLGDCARALRRKFGEDTVRALLIENPSYILKNKRI